MQTTHTIFAAALLAAGALAMPSDSAIAGSYGWDAGCGCQRPIAYVQPQVYAPAPEVVNVYRPRVVYQPHVVYEAVSAVVVRAPIVHTHGCCGGGGLFTGSYGHGYFGGGYGGYGAGYGGVYGGYGVGLRHRHYRHYGHYGYGATD